jgi:hypothetical protein
LTEDGRCKGLMVAAAFEIVDEKRQVLACGVRAERLQEEGDALLAIIIERMKGI